MPVIPDTQEAEAGELVEPRKQRLPLHFSLGNKSKTPFPKKEKKKMHSKRIQKK